MKKNDSLTGKEFAARIRIGESGNLSGHRISGDVDLTGVTVENPLIIRNAIFTGEVNFSQARFKRGVDLTDCHFEKKLILLDARIEGPLKLDNVIIGTDDRPPADVKLWKRQLAKAQAGQQEWETCADFDNVRVEGSLSMTRIQ